MNPSGAPREQAQASDYGLLRCPCCGARLGSDGAGARCSSCRRGFAGASALLDLRADPEPEPAEATAGGSGANVWRDYADPAPEPRDILAADAVSSADQRHAHVLQGTDCAWQLFLDLRPGMRALDLACGYGARSASLLELGLHVVATDFDPQRARVAGLRLSRIGAPATRIVLLVSTTDELPVADSAFDVVLLPVDPTNPRAYPTAAHNASALPRQVRRVLAPGGQILLLGANRWAYQALADRALRLMGGAASRRRPERGPGRAPPSAILLHPGLRGLVGYRRYLRSAGSLQVRTCVLRRNRAGNLEEIRPPEQDAGPRRKTGFKSRLKDSATLAQEFAMIGTAAGGEPRVLFERVLEDLGRSVPRAGGHVVRKVKVRHCHLSRKDKLVAEVQVGDALLVVRMALSGAARFAERQGCVVRDRIRQARPDAHWFPHVLAVGCVSGIHYVAEEHRGGTALARDRDTLAGNRSLAIASDLLERMNPGMPSGGAQPLTGERYLKLVEEPLVRLCRFAGLPADRSEAFGRYLHEELHGLQAGIGVTHGDFSASNILVEADGALTVIDWEDGDPDGLPILDAFTFLNSRRLAMNAGRVRRGTRVSPLASDDLGAGERVFLEAQYARTGTDPRAHLALVCLRWLRMASALTAFSFMAHPDNIRFYIHEVFDGYMARIREGGIRGFGAV